MILRPFLNDESSCASYLFGCLSRSQLAVVDPHVDLVDAYLDAAAVIGAPIVAVFETHVQADHVSGLPALVERTGAQRLPPGRCGRRVRPPRTWRTTRRSSWATRSSARSPRRATPQPITPTWCPICGVARASRGWHSRATRSSSATSGGPTCTSPATRRARQGNCTTRSPACMAAARWSAGAAEPLRRVGVWPLALGKSVLVDRVRAPPQRDARPRRRGRVRRRPAARHTAATGRAEDDRGAQPPGRQRRAPVSVAPTLGLRANASQFALLVALNGARRCDGRTRAQRAATDR